MTWVIGMWTCSLIQLSACIQSLGTGNSHRLCGLLETTEMIKPYESSTGTFLLMSNPLGNSSNLVVLQRLFILKSFWIDICMQRLLEDPTINSPSHLPICFSTQHKKAFEDSPEWCTVFTMVSLSCLPQREQQGWYFLAQKHLVSIAFPLNAMHFFLVFAAKWASVFLFLNFLPGWICHILI